MIIEGVCGVFKMLRLGEVYQQKTIFKLSLDSKIKYPDRPGGKN